ncbi:hypothetical protein Nepgr_020922 [Nepenthes gracilis]|uniref:Uncharacterized protein n=1 Tax=Nepenthes gracilis TaxID=150966 RepID=A0AAD3XWU8_NEPGR|nr:hypothetical protein Nepgr_020922 [Nepenthes gracilis]
MADEKSRDLIDDRKIYSVDREDKIDGDELIDSSSTVISPASDIEASATGSVVNSIASGDGTDSCLSDRLSEILMDNSDGDVLLQQSDRETNFLPWLQALDMQMMGACRADERLKPLLKVNNPSSGAAEDRLLAHLSQHFAATEVGLLARCLCIPLVSIRVGKVSKQGTLLCPSSSRGNLNLTLLPSSNFRISFVGDNGKTDRLTTLTSRSECSAVAIERIPADESGRCFLIKISRDEVFYFWCSEKSKLLGLELLSKMEDLLKKKLTLAEMTGICDSRLERFATHLRDYLIGSKLSHSRASNASLLNPVLDLSSDATKLGFSAQLSSASANHLHPHHDGGQAFNTHPVSRGSLSPRSCSFKRRQPPQKFFSPTRCFKRKAKVPCCAGDGRCNTELFGSKQETRCCWKLLGLSIELLGVTGEISNATDFECIIAALS